MGILRSLAAVFALAASTALASPTLVSRAHPKGIDVSGFQPHVNWHTVKSRGVSFAYIKATEGTTFKSPTFSSQYTGAAKAGILRGAYHFAHPGSSSGAAQAKFFIAHGGGWSGDGKTLPGTLDIEYNPNGAECYGLSHGAMVAWIKDFTHTYHTKTKRYPVIYTTTDWWNTCTGNSAAFSKTSPLWIAHFSSKVGALPAGWSHYTFWQHSDNASPNPGDADVFHADMTSLKKFAKG